MLADGPDQPSAQVRHPFLADLLQALPEAGEHLHHSLHAVLLRARASCPSCVAVSVTLDHDHDGKPVTITATIDNGHRRAPSMTVQLPRLNTTGPAQQSAVLVVFATDALALARLAVDVTTLLGMHRRGATLAAAAVIPTPMSAGLVLAGQLADRTAVARALGALLEQGWVPTEGRRELQRRADAAGASLVQAAATVLAALPGVPPETP